MLAFIKNEPSRRKGSSSLSHNLPYEKIGKNEPICIADEVPFAIPESWEWVRLGSVINLQSGQDLTPDKYNDTAKGIPYITGASNIENGKVIINRWTEYGRAFAYKDELLITCKGTVGTMAFLKEEKVHIARQIMAIHPSECISPEYLQIVFETLVEGLKAAAKSMIPGISREDILTSLVPLPPMSEQKRIAQKLYEILPLIEVYDKKEQAISILNSEFPELLKKSILQQAVMGKLVPQDENDEPASILLERIRVEKQQLIAERKLKKDKHESRIYRRDNSHYEKIDGKEICIDDEIPFKIPNTWEWARASSIGSMVRGKGIKRTETVPKGVPCVRYGEIYTSYNVSFSDTISFIDELLDKNCLHFSTGDIIFTLTGENKVDIAKAVAYFGNEKVAAGGDLAYWTAHGMNPLYLVYYMASPYCIERKRRTATGDIIVHISTDKVGAFLVPIPPIKEQNRIVEAISRAFLKVSAL